MNQNDLDELPPDWLNADFFTNVLKNYEKENKAELVDFKISSTTNKKEHYGSLMYRATVEYRQQNELKKQSMIIKAMFVEPSRQQEMFKDSTIFKTEIQIYSEVIPKFESMLKTVGDETKLAPRVLYHSLRPQQIIVFEDLAPLGYTVLNDRASNFEETKAVFTKIAKWHACSYKLNIEHSDLLKPFHHNIFETVGLKDLPAFQGGIENFIALLESESDLTCYIPYFKPLLGKSLDYWERAALEFLQNRQPECYYVLCHGDFQHRNMMFKSNIESGKVEDLLLLDFQLCYMGPIVNDLISSIYLVMDAEQRLQNLDKLIYFYFDNFIATLRKIGFQGPMPKLIEFRNQMMRHKGYDLFLFTCLLPILMAIDGGLYGIEEMMTNAEVRKSIYKNPAYVEQVRKLLPKYLHMGYLEVDEH